MAISIGVDARSSHSSGRGSRIDTFGPVVASSLEQRRRWLDRARTSGSRLVHGALSPAQRRAQRLFAWLAALRLQFYPMTWIAYTVGALAASAGKPMSMTPYLLGYLTLFLLEAATVFLNDWFDFNSDRRNRNAGPFTGGSRVLVDGRLERSAMRKGIGLSLLAVVAALLALLAAAPAELAIPIATLYAVFAMLALIYTVPPLKLSHRGFGELDVALTHSAGAIMAGIPGAGRRPERQHAVAAGATAGRVDFAVDPAAWLAAPTPRPAELRPSARSW
jgi:4-hydroxybenzoate polyprenyltransferase